ncbi:MAG: F(420)H(2) dehydrogenase subunit L [Candidatus Heimdallarchaeota archaeon LC_2]|nr:MAG: F(420)H(2) dehydrogenase subunit L [Candidatus Heimdallarchaeota archaeon LC_2]
MAGEIHHFGTDENIIVFSILVILVPFITGIFLMGVRGLEIKRGKNYSERFSSIVGVGGLATSWIFSILVAIDYFRNYITLGEHAEVDKIQYDYEFLPSHVGSLKWGILLDPLAVIFLVVLTTIAFLIHLYSKDYMHADPSYTRFFGTMNFFTASMLGFILAPNLFMGFIFWEFLGFSSYLLIGFYWHKPSASSAMKKAFLYNKVGDVSFMVGIALIYRKMVVLAPNKSLDYLEIARQIEVGGLKFGDMIFPALLIFGGAVGKSAQFPLFGWLPEAMEGPTPVSSLLHSSTMVKAGLFLVARNYFLFYQNQGSEAITHVTGVVTQSNLDVASIVAWTGTITALLGALIALSQGDIKKVLAFSTISQLGYIMMALGSGGITAGFYHIISHATFKSLLFLCAGAVIHSVHSQDMKDMGGLKNYMPATTITMGIGLLGLSGVIFTNGFWSKDAVLLSIKENDAIIFNELAWGIAVLTAGITAFYSAKLFILVFLGEGRYDRDHVHPAPTARYMKIPLIALASLVVIESIWWTFGTLIPSLRDNHASYWNFEVALGSLLNTHGGEFTFADAVPSTLMGLIGITLAFVVYYWEIPAAVSIKASSFMASLEKVAYNRFGVDKLIYWIVETPVMWIGDRFQYVDKEIIDGIFVDQLAAEGSLFVAEKSDDFDRGIIDGTVDWFGNRTRDIGYNLRTHATGKTPNYARFISLGLASILLIFTLNNLISF